MSVLVVVLIAGVVCVAYVVALVAFVRIADERQIVVPLKEYPPGWEFSREDASDVYIHGVLTGVIIGSLLVGLLSLLFSW